MNPRLHANTPVRGGHVSHDSPKVHAAGVKLGNAKNSLNIEKKKNSLSSFTLSPVPTPARAYVRARVTGGESRETSPSRQFPECGTRSPTFAPCGVLPATLDEYATVAGRPTRANVAYTSAIPPVVGTSRQSGQAAVCGNSSPVEQSLFCRSEHERGPNPERRSHVGFYPF